MDNILLSGFNAHDAGMALSRIAVGSFFAISGYHKLFNAVRHASLVKTLTDLKVPFVGFNQWWVPTVEFAGGLALIAGLGSVIAAAMLFVICFVACVTDGVKRVADWKPIDKADVVDDWLYLPEAIYMLLLGVVIFSGPGKHSLDAMLFL